MSEQAKIKRYCNDCRFFQPHELGDRFGRCGNPAGAEKFEITRFVSAELDVDPPNKFATIMRAYGECGEDAKLFEPKSAQAVKAA